MIKRKIIEFVSDEYLSFKDITDLVEEFVKKSKIKEGTVLIYSPHTTQAVAVNEKEKGIFADFKDLVNRLIPKENYYRHNDLSLRTENLVCEIGASDCINGHSHCGHLLMKTSELVPISKGKMMLGCWQRIFLIELDCSRKRRVIVQISN